MNAATTNSFFGSQRYFWAALALSIPVWIAMENYAKSLNVVEDEAAAIAATTLFLLGVFAGRYLVQVSASTLTEYPKNMLTALVAAIFVFVAWIFFHADFHLQGRTAINLILFWVPLSLLAIALGAVIKIVHAVIQNQLKAAQTEAAQNKSELGLLQSQLSPHFLFNTLNNLYGLSLTDHQKLPPLLLKLSELLRYSVYDAGDTYVALRDELAYVRNYIEFEKIRLGERLRLQADLQETVDEAVKIAPMLLIVFIENAFKYAKNTVSPEVFVDINLRTWGSFILFSIRNSYGREEQLGALLNKHSGLGLTNVRKRLELLYPAAYQLDINDDGVYYTVELQLKIK